VSERDPKPGKASAGHEPGKKNSPRIHVRRFSVRGMSVPRVSVPKVAPPSVPIPSNQDVGNAAARSSRLMAMGWWLFRTGRVRHRVTMFRLYSSTVRTRKRPK